MQSAENEQRMTDVWEDFSMWSLYHVPCSWTKMLCKDKDHLQSELYNCYQDRKSFVVDLSGRRTARCHRQRAPGWIPEKVTWDWSARSSYRFANFLIRDQWETWVAQSSLHLGVWDCVVRCVDQDALKRWPPPHNLSTLWGFVRITKHQVSFQTFCGARRPGLHPTVCVSQASQCCAA